MVNNIILQGRLVADPELRHTTSSVAVCNLRIAVDRDFKDKETGDRKADFIDIVVWRQSAEFVARHFAKGSMILVQGSLQSRTYEDRDGRKRHATEVAAERVWFGEPKRAERSGMEEYAAAGRAHYAQQQGQAQFSELPDQDGSLPFF